ncbi:hypothetical protein J2S74_004135 [Evansella vedderi]|uniref:Uncharacterized protein n=1 Tax=Evansella vedderi TaxID=38282 RepID=A0ABT9ZZP0_9BACI|nr:hypothetical protein [Evansella vedderi]MDQ0256713.1 hypothetical protein [Evansella vedderi]
MKLQNYLQHIYIFYSIIFVGNIVNLFIGNARLNYILGIFAIIMLFIAFIGASKLFRIMGCFFLLLGTLLFVKSGQSIAVIPPMLTSNLSLLTLLAMLPWMNSVVKTGGFERTLNELLKLNVSNLGSLYPRSSASTLTLAAFLNLSAVSISQEVLKGNLAAQEKLVRNAFINKAVIRGYSLALMWSPLEIMIAVSIFTTGVTFVSVLFWLFFISAITFIIDSLWGFYQFKKYPYEILNSAVCIKTDRKVIVRKLIHFISALVLFLILVIFLGNLFQLDFILTVTLLIFPFALLWAIFLKRGRRFWKHGWNNWKIKTNNMHNFIVLFVSLSFFAGTLDGSSFINQLQGPLLYFGDYPMVLFLIILIIFIALSMFGVHPIATIGILGGLISPLYGVLNPISVAIVFITSAVATLTVGTYGLLVTLTSMNLKENPYRITLDNLPFAFLLGGIGITVAYFLL